MSVVCVEGKPLRQTYRTYLKKLFTLITNTFIWLPEYWARLANMDSDKS